MQDEPTPNSVPHVEFQAGPADELETIELISSQEVEQAARALIPAAVSARRTEFIAHPDGPIWPTILDIATGDVYVARPEGGWRCGDTLIDVHPSDTVTAEEYEGIVDAFTYFHERWPAYPHAMATRCHAAKKAIRDGQMASVNEVSRAVQAWGGYARDSFLRNFLDPFLTISLPNQQALLDELTIAMHAYEAILRQGRLDARLIAEKTVAVLNALAAEEDGEFSFSLLFGVLAAVAGVVAAVASGGTSLALTAGVLAAGLSGAEVIADNDEGGGASIAGATVDEVLRSMRAALDDLRKQMVDAENAIAYLLEEQEAEVRRWLRNPDPQTVATILPNEPDDDNIDNLTSGQIPGRDDFRTRH